MWKVSDDGRQSMLELSIARHRSWIMNKLEAKSKRQTLLIKHQDFIKVNKKYEGLLEIHRKHVKYSHQDELDEGRGRRWTRGTLGRPRVGRARPLGFGRPLAFLPPLASSFRRDRLLGESCEVGPLDLALELCLLWIEWPLPLERPWFYTPEDALYMESLSLVG